jgi:hypothetical protein
VVTTPLERAQQAIARVEQTLAQPRPEGPSWQLPEPEPASSSVKDDRTRKSRWTSWVRHIATEQARLAIKVVGGIIAEERRTFLGEIALRDGRIAALEQRLTEIEAGMERMTV